MAQSSSSVVAISLHAPNVVSVARTKLNRQGAQTPYKLSMNDQGIVTFLKVAAVPCLLGLLVSSSITPEHAPNVEQVVETDARRTMVEEITDVDFPAFDKVMSMGEKGDPFDNLSFVVHRNGESEPCAQTISEGLYKLVKRKTLESFDDDLDSDYDFQSFDKYYVDALLTKILSFALLGKAQCPPYHGDNGERGTWGNRINNGKDDALASFVAFCDSGPKHTPILPDHDELVMVMLDDDGEEKSFPCHFHTREGVMVKSLEMLADIAREARGTDGQTCDPQNNSEDTCAAQNNSTRELHLYAVPAGRVFMFASSYVGEIFELPHVKVASGEPVSLEVLSLSPRVFDVKNFYSQDESALIVKKALAETSESHRIKRSSTGASGYNVNSRRTSENGFDTHGKVAMEVKRRCFDVLGFGKYEESMADGLQVLRYNMTTAYTPHLDWIDDYRREQEHNFDSEGVGSNRFATILLYMSDLGENDGGETVFAEGWPHDLPEEERQTHQEALQALRESGDAKDLARGSWEEGMVAKCRSRLSIRPHSSRAVLFYSQHPNGRPDKKSLHGGCPVLNGTKWAANLWVWNAPRSGYPGAPKNEDVVKRNRKKGINEEASTAGSLHATFSNTGTDKRFENAKLHFQDTFWGNLGFGDSPLAVNTFEGHQWNLMVDGQKLVQWTIDKRPRQQYSI